MIKVLCFGNEFWKEDSLAKEIADLKIGGVEFIRCTFVDEVLKFIGEKIIILDVVEGLKEVKLLKVEDLKIDKSVTLHDFDLGFFLLLLKDMRVKDIKIVGIPIKGDRKKIEKDIKTILKGV